MKKVEVISKARTKFLRVSPRKVRYVIDLIRGENVNQALAILAHLNKGAKGLVEKTLRAAISNAKQNPSARSEELFIAKITADNGPMFKRYRAAAMGRAVMIRHRTTHLTIELAQSPVKQIKILKKKVEKKKAVSTNKGKR